MPSLGHGATRSEESTNCQQCGGNKDMLYSQFTGKAESLLISSKICKVYGSTVRENRCLTIHDQRAGVGT
jgi:hypothetical protein